MVRARHDPMDDLKQLGITFAGLVIVVVAVVGAVLLHGDRIAVDMDGSDSAPAADASVGAGDVLDPSAAAPEDAGELPSDPAPQDAGDLVNQSLSDAGIDPP